MNERTEREAIVSILWAASGDLNISMGLELDNLIGTALKETKP